MSTHKFPPPPNGHNRSPLDINIGPVNQAPLDRFGTALRAGSLVLFRPEVDVVFEVVEVTPMLDPRIPTGTVQVMLRAQFPVMLPARQPYLRMIAIGSGEKARVAEDPLATPPEPDADDQP